MFNIRHHSLTKLILTEDTTISGRKVFHNKISIGDQSYQTTAEAGEIRDQSEMLDFHSG
jgi:hypothetical protein